jgi:hypothetical protein
MEKQPNNQHCQKKGKDSNVGVVFPSKKLSV